MSAKAYEKITKVLETAGRPLAPHEFGDVTMTHLGEVAATDGRRYVGYSESTIARRLREMVGKGLAKSKTREGSNFKEFATTALIAVVLTGSGCAAASKTAPTSEPLIWSNAAVDVVKDNAGCHAIQLGFRQSGQLAWRAVDTACPKTPEQLEAEKALEIVRQLKKDGKLDEKGALKAAAEAPKKAEAPTPIEPPSLAAPAPAPAAEAKP